MPLSISYISIGYQQLNYLNTPPVKQFKSQIQITFWGVWHANLNFCSDTSQWLCAKIRYTEWANKNCTVMRSLIRAHSTLCPKNAPSMSYTKKDIKSVQSPLMKSFDISIILCRRQCYSPCYILTLCGGLASRDSTKRPRAQRTSPWKSPS